MSEPANPLAKYRSYAYQQILVVCDTTETAEKISASNEFLEFTRPQSADRNNVPENPYAKYEPYDINLSKGRKGSYVILINGLKDAEFVISKAHWYNAVAASAGGEGNQFSTMNAGGELTISEPQGIRFMNVLAHVADSLGSDPGGLIFMIKTIFVGYAAPTFEKSDGFPDPMTNIKPLLFFLSNLTGSFSITGGEYKIEFAGINHGTTKQRHILHGADRIKINIASREEGCEANTLSGALCKLQSRIGTIYTTYFEKMKKTVENTTTADGKKLEFNGRRVTYIITAEAPLDGPEYLVTDFKDSATDTAETGAAGMIELSKEPSVEAAILAIAKRCPKVQDDLVTKDGSDITKIRYVLKVATTIQSTDTDYKIIYHLRRVVESREDILKVISERTDDHTDSLSAAIQRNILTFEYMYTGQNTDILDFDLTMKMGLTLFQNLATTDNLPTSADNVNGTSPATETAEERPIEGAETFNGRVRPNTPIFLSTKVKKETLKHSTRSKRAIDFQELMNRHAALENLEAVLKIHGNPGLLNTVSKLPTEILETKNFSDTLATIGSEDNQDPLPYWETIPAIIKVNIKMPSVYYGGAQQSSDFGEDFWYRGFYYCYAIEQTFDGGEFTQQLHMISVPKNSPEENTQKEVSQTAQVQQTEKANAASDTPGSGTTSGIVPIANAESEWEGITIVIEYAGDALDAHSGN